jgi:hypothetical protein
MLRDNIRMNPKTTRIRPRPQAEEAGGRLARNRSREKIIFTSTFGLFLSSGAK